MRTDDLINALGADAAATPPSSLARAWSVALAGGALAAVVLMMLTLRIRDDIHAAMFDARFLFKFVATLALAIPATWLAMQLARPQARPGHRLLALGLAPALLLLAAATELVLIPQAGWAPRAIGVNSLACLASVPLLSLAPLALMLFALSRGAPTNARLAGLVAGLAAGGIGATAYAAHCVDDSPLFVAIWYTMGVAMVASLGAWLGPRVLRW